MEMFLAAPLNKRRLLPKPPTEPERRRCRRFTDLPVEIIGEVVCYLEPKDAVNILSTCKLLNEIMRPDGAEGRRNWRILRQRLGWPDPASIGMTDIQFLKRQYGRGCDYCANAPRIRIPKWEFFGMRMCKSCLDELTWRDYMLGVQERIDCLTYLPSVIVPGPPRIYNWPTYRLFLKFSVRSMIVHKNNWDDGVLEELKESSRVSMEFAAKIKTNTRTLLLERRQKIVAVVDSRRVEVDKVMKEYFPAIDPKVYATIGAYQNAVKRRTPFTKRSKLALVKYITKHRAFPQSFP